MAGRENKKRFVGLNTALLLILGLVSGASTVWGVTSIKRAMHSVADVSNALVICHDGSENHENLMLKNARLCEKLDEKKTEDVTNNESALFIYNHLNRMTEQSIAATMMAIIVVGSMITLGAFVSALVYFLHNKENR